MPGVIDVKETQKRLWTAAAAGWDRHFDFYERAFAPMTEWCADAVALRPGDVLLDVACGTGLLALEAARRVGPDGSVVAIDLSDDMVTRTVGRARSLALARVSGRVMDAEALDFPDGSFDAVTCTCGLMFFPDARRAVAEMHRVLKPGGRLAASVWDDPSKSPFLTVAGRAFAEVFPPAPQSPNTPAAFRFAASEELSCLFADAGFRQVNIVSVPMAIACDSPAHYWNVIIDMAAGIGEKLAKLDGAGVASLRRTVEARAAEHLFDGRVRLTATPLCAGAIR